MPRPHLQNLLRAGLVAALLVGGWAMLCGAAIADDAVPRLADADAHLERAAAYQENFEIEPRLAHLRAAVALDDTSRSSRALADALLALGLFEDAETALDAALARHPQDSVLLEQRAELAAAQGDDDAAVAWIERSWNAGRERLAWIERGRLAERVEMAPYRDLLDAQTLLEDLAELAWEAQEKRLHLLADALPKSAAPTAQAARLVDALISIDRAEPLRLGLRALRRLGEERSPFLAELLATGSPRVRRMALEELWSHPLEALVDDLRAHLRGESDPGNYDLTEILLARADDAVETVSEQNSYRFLVDPAASRPEIAAARKIDQATALESYWDCQDRRDLREIRRLLHHHRFVEPIDARIYGLPENDFDDQKNLTIPERLFLRQWNRQLGTELTVDGPMQYHRESRNLLRRMQEREGTYIDCSGRLATFDPGLLEVKTLAEDGTEMKLFEDNAADNEVHIAVNPWNPQFVVATSNPSGSGGNEVYRSSNWGNSWTHGSATVANNCCDPVSYYNRTDVGGTMTDVLYHSTLVEVGANVVSRMIYSTNNGSTWNDCGANIGNSRDRQDHAVDTNPASACYNTIYLGHHNGTQYVAASTGASFPYCQSWNEQSTGVGGTIGSAIVVSTNGRAHNIFTQYSPGGVFITSTSNCGQGWSTAAKIATVTNGGDFEWGIPSTCSRQVYRYPQADSDRQTQSAYKNNIYAVWNDLSGNCSAPGCGGNTTCNNDIYLLVGTPNNRDNPTSWTWQKSNLTAPLSDDYTDEFYPSLTVDQADGAIHVTYYRTNSGAPGGSANIGPRKTQVHYVATRSIDGGATWETPYRITDLPTDESGSGANLAMQWGDYSWNDVIDGVAYGVWTDRREGADEDVWASKICSEPAHWSERAPSFTAPATQAAPAGGTAYTVSWTAPDLFWGDADENPAARKYQLWVDGSLAQNNIAWTATSTAWTAPDTSSHSLVVRAVNQCGVAKDYGAVVVGDGAPPPPPPPPPGCDNAGLDDNFEGDVSGWTLTGLWHAANSSSCASPAYASATHAMYFGEESFCDYFGTGTQTTGTLTSPAIDGIDAQSILRFAYFRDVESTQNLQVDRTEVLVAPDGSDTWQSVWLKTSLDASAASWATTSDISLAAWAGQRIRVRFVFDTVDEEFNAQTGWMVDDVVVTGTCPDGGGNPDEIFVDGFESGDQSSWSGFGQ